MTNPLAVQLCIPCSVITDQADGSCSACVADFNIQRTFKAARLIDTDEFNTICNELRRESMYKLE